MATVTTTQVASSEPFDNSTNGFIATNSQEAIEETKGKIQYTVSINRNGRMSNNDWLGRSETMGNTSSFVANRNVSLIGIAWANSNSGCQFSLEFYKNGRTTTKFRTYTASNLTYGYDFGWNDLFNAGDFLDIKYIDNGQNASDFGIDLYFSVE